MVLGGAGRPERAAIVAVIIGMELLLLLGLGLLLAELVTLVLLLIELQLVVLAQLVLVLLLLLLVLLVLLLLLRLARLARDRGHRSRRGRRVGVVVAEERGIGVGVRGCLSVSVVVTLMRRDFDDHGANWFADWVLVGVGG